MMKIKGSFGLPFFVGLKFINAVTLSGKGVSL